MKICSSCLLDFESPEDFFYKNPNTKDGLGSQCNICDNNGRVFKNRDKKQRLVLALGGCCSKCGYAKSLRALQFHHPNDDKEHELSKLLKKKFETALVEAKKCVLLCANCHAEEHELNLDTLHYGGTVRGGPIPHGTVAGYKRCKPHCEKCKAAWNEYCKVYRKSKAGL